VIALHSPDALVETGLRTCPPEKNQGVAAFYAEQSVLYSPVRWAIIAKNGRLSRIFEEMVAEFLCSPDCVAERKGFEPSVQV